MLCKEVNGITFKRFDILQVDNLLKNVSLSDLVCLSLSIVGQVQRLEVSLIFYKGVGVGLEKKKGGNSLSSVLCAT